MLREDFDGGKYTVIEDDLGQLTALRHGQQWRDLTGDKLVLTMLQEVSTMRLKFKALIEASRRT